jgi:hypothetical protein
MGPEVYRRVIALVVGLHVLTPAMGAGIVGVAFDNGNGVPTNWNAPQSDGTQRNLINEAGIATGIGVTLTGYLYEDRIGCINRPPNADTVPTSASNLGYLNTYCQLQPTADSAEFFGLDPTKKYRVWLIGLRTSTAGFGFEQEWDIVGRSTLRIVQSAERGQLAVNTDLGSSTRDFASYALTMSPNSQGRIRFDFLRAIDPIDGYSMSGKVAGLAIQPVDSTTHYGLFIGANDPAPRSMVRFDKNAQTIANAFGSRPNTKVTVLTGDLTLDANGKPKSPITPERIAEELSKIRSKMNAGDTLTLYINNHGGSFTREWIDSPVWQVNDEGVGDEFIWTGGYLIDNALAKMLKAFAGFPVAIFLDSCHSGGFWGSNDVMEYRPPGEGVKDLDQLASIAMYAAASESRPSLGLLESLSYWGKALKDAFETTSLSTGIELADFLRKRTREYAWAAYQVSPVWYSHGPGDPYTADMALIDPFDAHSADFDMQASLLPPPDPALQISTLSADVTGVGPGNSLAYKMDLVRSYFQADDIDATCATLKSFVHEVRAQSGKKIADSDADRLIASAQFTITAIGCQ